MGQKLMGVEGSGDVGDLWTTGVIECCGDCTGVFWLCIGTITAVGWATETANAGWFAGARGTMGTGTPSGRAF